MSEFLKFSFLCSTFNGFPPKFIDFEFKDKSSIRVWCVDWTEFVENSKSFADSLSISISPNYFFDWLNTEAYE